MAVIVCPVRVTAQSRLGLVLRAAALADLYLTGRVTDENGMVRATGDGGPAGSVCGRPDADGGNCYEMRVFGEGR